MNTSDGASREQDIVEEISQNLANTRYTFGVSSTQYQAVLDMLKAHIADVEKRPGRLDDHTTKDSDVEGLILLLERELKV